MRQKIVFDRCAPRFCLGRPASSDFMLLISRKEIRPNTFTSMLRGFSRLCSLQDATQGVSWEGDGDCNA